MEDDVTSPGFWTRCFTFQQGLRNHTITVYRPWFEISSVTKHFKVLVFSLCQVRGEERKREGGHRQLRAPEIPASTRPCQAECVLSGVPLGVCLLRLGGDLRQPRCLQPVAWGTQKSACKAHLANAFYNVLGSQSNCDYFVFIFWYCKLQLNRQVNLSSR